MASTDDQPSTDHFSTEPCLRCGRDLRDRGDYLECERCGHLEYP